MATPTTSRKHVDGFVVLVWFIGIAGAGLLTVAVVLAITRGTLLAGPDALFYAAQGALLLGGALGIWRAKTPDGP